MARHLGKYIAQAADEIERLRLSTGEAIQSASAATPWRCFHCDESFDNAYAAQLHFGSSERQQPACTIDTAHLRELEAELSRYREEDTDLHQEIRRLYVSNVEAVRKAEEKGYARGLRDANHVEPDVGTVSINHGLTLSGYSDEDECHGSTLDEFAKARGCVIGDAFAVTEVWNRECKVRIVGGGPSAAEPTATFQFEFSDQGLPLQTAADAQAACHELKTDAPVFDPVLTGEKTHEIRFNDRDFKVGDLILLRETQYTGAEMKAGAPLIYTGRKLLKKISHVLTGYGLMDGWVILSFSDAL